MEPEYNMILSFWWIRKQAPSKPYGLPEIIWLPCKDYTKKNADKFSLKYSTEILNHPEALVVRLLTMPASNNDLLDLRS
jgi:hypothetical protein